jgi:hypothetical protein
MVDQGTFLFRLMCLIPTGKVLDSILRLALNFMITFPLSPTADTHVTLCTGTWSLPFGCFPIPRTYRHLLSLDGRESTLFVQCIETTGPANN